MSKQIKVLVFPSDTSGIGKYRSVDPHVYLNNNHKEDFFVDIVFDNREEVNFKDYDILHFHKFVFPQRPLEYQLNKIKEIQDGGTKVVMDLDDYWDLPNGHPLSRTYKDAKYAQVQLSMAKASDYVTTTTPLFADELKKSGVKNIIVLENSIDPEESQFTEKTEKSDKVRFGWLGGASHLEDIKLLEGLTNKLQSRYKEQYQMVLCGFDTRGSMIERLPNGQTRKRPIKPLETQWFKYETIITDKFRIIDNEYRDHLLKFNNSAPYDDIDKPYRRIWTKPITDYAKGYSQFDVSLAPLVENTFNKVKSELKVIESGFYKKPIIAQDFGPYSLICKSAWGRGEWVEGNSLLVESRKNHKQWFEHARRFIENPTLVDELGEKLYDTVKDKYHLKTTTQKRAEFYKTLINI